MIWGQIAWGVLLAGLLGFTFHRAWKWEHGSEAHVLFSQKYGKETYVFVPPTVLFWILLVFLVMLLLVLFSIFILLYISWALLISF